VIGAVAYDDSHNPRILILESDRRTSAALRRYVVKEWRGASVQSVEAGLGSIVGKHERLSACDAILAGCDFANDGTADNPTFRALRAIAADPDNPPVILLTERGSEYTAVQAMKAGAFDCIAKNLLGKEQLITAVQRALLARTPARGERDVTSTLNLFGYDIRRCLASHRGVSVHVAYSAERGEEVVLKVLHRGRGSLARDTRFERFVDEYKLLYDIDDPAVARIYDFRVTSHYAYIAMEYFPDGHLGRRIAEAIEVEEALSITVEIAQALAIIHAAGVVHRDLKPGNIMLRRNGTVALIDFGISQSRPASTPAPFDQGELITGTPYYMSPEQVRGDATDERTDLYALGVIFYQMLTGTKPYVGNTAEEIMSRHRDAPVPKLPSGLREFQPLVDRLLAKSAKRRVSNARELIELIDRMQDSERVRGYELSATSA
jgi:eukaryotic-like serine/threonine-protein kinase